MLNASEVRFPAAVDVTVCYMPKCPASPWFFLQPPRLYAPIRFAKLGVSAKVARRTVLRRADRHPLNRSE